MLTIETTNESREMLKAQRLIEKEIGSQVFDCLATNPSYVPTIRDRKCAVALAVLGFRSWNPRTGQTW
jgi:hypothetical protein